jgi:hypothetical protein
LHSAVQAIDDRFFRATARATGAQPLRRLTPIADTSFYKNFDVF